VGGTGVKVFDCCYYPAVKWYLKYFIKLMVCGCGVEKDRLFCSVHSRPEFTINTHIAFDSEIM
jgi:hypothetical protein